MFGYRHGFHAGNHGDVLKHVVLVQMLSYLTGKDAPPLAIDEIRCPVRAVHVHLLHPGKVARRMEQSKN